MLNREEIKVGVYLQCQERPDAVRLVIETKKHVFKSVWLSLREDGLHSFHGIETVKYGRFENSSCFIKN